MPETRFCERKVMVLGSEAYGAFERVKVFMKRDEI